MNIRTATPADIPFLLQLDRDSTTAAHWTLEQYTNLFRDGAGARRLFLLAEREDVPLGFLVAQTYPSRLGTGEHRGVIYRSAAKALAGVCCTL